MSTKNVFPLLGSCTCRHIQFRMETAPLIVHCCHCRYCQRETGSAFALNASIEASNITLISGQPVMINTPSHSGRGQQIARCPTCHVAVWSIYAGSGPMLKYIRVGALESDVLKPNVHIFAASKQNWVQLGDEVPVVQEYYEREKIWSKESLERWKVLLPEVEKYRATVSKA